MENAYIVLVEKLKGRDHVGDLDVDESNIEVGP
jgi:hypothetical protein